MLSQDGNIVQELYHIEDAMYRSILDNSNDPYTCKVANILSELACLDVASSSTLSGSINTSTSDATPEIAVYYHGLGIETSGSLNLFGNSAPCASDDESSGKRIGDGMLDSLDLFVYLSHYFRVPPYDSVSSLPSEVLTVEGESDVRDRCGDDITRTSYMSQYDRQNPCTRPRKNLRRLTDGSVIEYSPVTSINIYTYKVVDEGTWFHIYNPSIVLSIYYTLENVDTEQDVYLSNAPVSDSMVPVDGTRYEIRFQRHIESQYLD